MNPQDPFRPLIKQVAAIEEPHQKHNCLNALIRSMLHHYTIGMVESIAFHASNIDADSSKFYRFSQVLAQPNDSTPIRILDSAIVILRNQISHEVAMGWFPREGGTVDGLHELLTTWVGNRNSTIGHGCLSQEEALRLNPEYEHLARTINEVLTAFCQSDGDRFIYLLSGNYYPITTIKPSDDGPAIIRRIHKRRGEWVAQCKYFGINFSKSCTLAIPTRSPLVELLESEPYSAFRYAKVMGPDLEHQYLTNAPERMSEVFTGRQEEMAELLEWFNDYNNSNSALVWGDGGVGKTTLVVEFLNDLLEDEIKDVRWFPDVIFFFTAKMTKWTPTGFVHVRGIAPALEEAIRDLARSVHDELDRKWYSADLKKCISLLKEGYFERNEVLLVLDNTETLSSKTGMEQDVARSLRQIANHVGRTIITSRRRENIEARPIQVNPMDDQTGAAFLRNLSERLGAKPILDAGESRLQRIVRDLAGKPLLLEILVRHLCQSANSIDEALEKTNKAAREGLSDFLYDDAWRRMKIREKKVFCVLSALRSPPDNLSVSWVCQEIGIPHSDWIQAFQEAPFGSIQSVGNDYNLILEPMAMEFFLDKATADLADDQKEIFTLAKSIDQKQSRLRNAKAESFSDRKMKAFRKPAARAAKLAANRGDVDEAELWFLEAIDQDSKNSNLLDRFAYFYLNKKGDLAKAGEMAQRATEIDKANSDALLILAQVNFRQGHLSKGDAFCRKAFDKGASVGQKNYLMAKARFESAKRERHPERRVELLEQGLKRTSVYRSIDPFEPYGEKQIQQLRSLELQIRMLLNEAKKELPL